MTRSQQAALEKIIQIGPAVCNVCGRKMRDVVQIRKNWISSINLCDSCGRQLFIRYRSDLGGEER